MKSEIKSIFQYFFKLGFVAFGGPAAHIAMMQKDLVEDKKWMSQEEFLDYMGATSLIPGPNSTEMTMHAGYHRGGALGLFVAGMSFIFPAVLITLLIAISYENISELEWTSPIISGIKAAVISFIVGAIIKLGQKAIKGPFLIVLAVMAVGAALLGINEIFVILSAGILAILYDIMANRGQLNSFAFLPILLVTATNYSHWKAFLIFLKVGAVLFGSGYVLFAYLDGELIDNLGWLTESDLVEAIAIGQVTPGPVLSTATFIGYKIGGILGAVLATLGIFLPSFFYVWLLNPFIKIMKGNRQLSKFLLGVNAAAVAVMVAVTYKMLTNIVVSWQTALICAISFFVYFYFKKLSPVIIIIGGGILGYLLEVIF